MEDFLEKDLPKTRKELIKYLFKYRKGLFIKIFFLLVPFMAPFFAWIIYSRYFFNPLTSDIKNVFGYLVTNNIPGLFLIFLFGVGLSGYFYSLRRIIMGESVVKHHFFKGIKESGFEFGLFISLYYLMHTLIDLLDKSILFKYVLTNQIIYYLFTFLFILINVFLIYIVIFILSSASLYVVSFNQAIKDAIYHIFRCKKSLAYYLVFIIAFVFLYNYLDKSYMYLNIFGALINILVFIPLCLPYLLGEIYEVFDKTINKISYPEYYKLGLYKGESDEA